MFNLVNGPSKIARLFLTTFLAISFTIIFSPEYIGKANSTIVVTTTEDELNNDGDCSLREAITAANTDMNVDNCPAGSSVDTIDLIPNEIFILKSVDNKRNKMKSYLGTIINRYRGFARHYLRGSVYIKPSYPL